MSYETPDHLSQWLFTEHDIQNTLSVLDGLSHVEERARRAKGVNFIFQAGILLKIPQLTLGTAAVFFHRFYMRYSMVPEKGGLHHYVRPSLPRSRSFQSASKPLISPPHEQNIAATALFLATKAEETCRKTKEIVVAVAKVAQKNASLIIDEQSKDFWRWKDVILLYEELMLELLTFDVVLESPYNFLMSFSRELDIDHNKPLRNVAWAFLNDSWMTTLCLRMPPRDSAIASIYFSAKFNSERIPDAHDGTPWWVRIGGDVDKILKAIAIMNEFYMENPMKRTDNPYEKSPEGSLEEVESTRRRAESNSSSTSQEAANTMADSQRNIQAASNGHINIAGPPLYEDQANSTRIPGDDDSRLKAIANDLTTHETGNGSFNDSTTPKRKEFSEDGVRESDIKRTRLANDGNENEEGEVEE